MAGRYVHQVLRHRRHLGLCQGLPDSGAVSVDHPAHEAGLDVIVDPRPQNRDCYAGCDYLTPNWRESRALLRWPDAEPTEDAASEVARALASEVGTNVVLTLGAHGMSFCGRNGNEYFALPTLAREVFKARSTVRLFDPGWDNTVRHFAALVDRCAVVVTGDTLAMYLSLALGRRIVLRDVLVDKSGRPERGPVWKGLPTTSACAAPTP